MDEEADVPNHSRKIRQRSNRNRTRATPYGRSKRKYSEGENVNNEGIIGKVTNLIVPTWISSWWKPDLASKNDGSESADSTDEEVGDVEQTLSNGITPHIKTETLVQDHSFKPTQPKISVSSQKEFLLSNRNSTTQSETFSLSTKYTNSTEATTKSIEISDTEENQQQNPVAEEPAKTSFYTNLRSQRGQPLPSKPAFKVSAFVSPLNQSTASTNVSFNSSLNASSFDFSMSRSPFYTGGTTFGGANSYRETSGKRMKLSPVSNRVRTTRTLMKAKPLPNTKKNIVTSQTAKRILNTLGKMSSPVKDSKRIPRSVFTKPALSELVKNQAKVVSRQSESVAPPVSSLNKPLKIVSKPENFQNKMDSIRRFNQKSEVKTQPAQVPSFSFKQQTVPPLVAPPKQEIKIQQPPKLPTAEPSKSSMKIKRDKMTSHFTMAKEPEVVNSMPEITSTAAPLPITVMPTFNFAKSALEKQKASNIFSPSLNVTPILKPTQEKQQEIKTKIEPPIPFEIPKSVEVTKSTDGFTFATPEVKGTKSFSTPLLKDFVFSTPVNLANKTKATSDIPKPTAKIEKLVVSTQPIKPSPAPVIEQIVKPSTTIKPFKELKQNNDNATWSCPTCMIDNETTDLKCVACETAKPGLASVASTVKSSAKSTFEIKPLKNLSKPIEDWNCPTCMIDNSNDDLKCVACETAKPGSKPVSSETSFSGFGKSSETGVKLPTDTGFKFNSVSTTGFKFGNDNSSGFKFNSDSTTTGFKFQSTENTGFKFPTKSVDEPFKGDASAEKKTTEVSEPSKTNNLFGKSAPSFSFGKPTETEKAPSFAFGKPSETEKAASFSFGKPTATEKAPSFSFGKSTDNEKAPSILSSSTSNKPAEVETPKPAFGSIAAAAAGGFLKVTGSPSVPFEPTITKPDPPKSTGFAFGQASSQSVFGSTSSSQSMLGSASKSESQPPAPSFNFGQTKSSTTSFGSTSSVFGQASTGSVFGTPVQSDSQSAAPTFNFGQNAAPAFNFGATQEKIEPQKTSLPSFGSSQPTESLFGAKKPEASAQPPFNFAAPSKPESVFGSVPTQPAASFNFGASSTVPSFETKPSGFILSANNSANPTVSQPPAPSGGFNFSAPNASFSFGATTTNGASDALKTGSVFGQQNTFGASNTGNLFAIGQGSNNSNNTSSGPMKNRQIRKAVRRKKPV